MTIAEQVARAFRAQTRTTPMERIAKIVSGIKVHHGESYPRQTHYIFPDQSVLVTSGRGRNHKFWTL